MESGMWSIGLAIKWAVAFLAALFGAGVSIVLKEESEKIELTTKMRCFYLFGGGLLAFIGANAAYEIWGYNPLSFIGIFGIVLTAIFGMGLCLEFTKQISPIVTSIRKRFIGGE